MNGETTISSKNNMDNFNLVYKDSNFTPKVPIDFIKNNIDKIISKESFKKYFTDSDIQKLSQFMPQTETNKINLICKILDPSSKIGLVHPLTCFNLMLKENFFTLPYQKQLDRFKIDSLEEFISIMEKKYDHLNKNKTSYKEILANSIIENDCEVTCGIISLPLPLPKIQDNTISSGYTTLSEEEREEVTETFYETEKIKTRYDGLEMESSLSDERFKNLKMSKNQLTIRPRTKEEIETFQKNELERYKNPHLPWIYNDIEGKATIVAPVLKKILTGNSNKPRDHVLLKSDRPSYVTILCLARDAASRLPDGVGTRSDICDLLKDSQYVIERLSDTHVMICLI
jgi:hypothetical protein